MTVNFHAIKNITEIFNPKFDQYGDWENATEMIDLLHGGPAPTADRNSDREDGPFHSYEVVKSKIIQDVHMSYSTFGIIRNAMAKITNQSNEEGKNFTWDEPFGSVLGRNDCYGWFPVKYVMKCSIDFKQYPSIDQALSNDVHETRKWANILYGELAELFHSCASKVYGIKFS
jgi:hypothetical protein